MDRSVAHRERVRIVYPSVRSGVTIEVELPLKLIVLGDFTRRFDETLLEERRPISVTRDNFNEVMDGFGLRLQVSVRNWFLDQNQPDTTLTLTFSRLADFEPTALAARIPELESYRLARPWLLKLRGVLGPNQPLSRKLEALVSDTEITSGLKKVWKDHGQWNNAGHVSGAEEPAKENDPLFWEEIASPWLNTVDPEDLAALKSAWWSFLCWCADQPARIKPTFRLWVERFVAEMDQRAGWMMDEILHHVEFQKLESTWRGLKFLVDRTDFRENIRIEILNVSSDDLVEDFTDNLEITKSGLYRLIYSAEYGQFGGQPYGAVVMDHEFSPEPKDIKLLTDLAAVAAMAHCPVIGGVSPNFFGLDDFFHLADLKDLVSLLDGPGLTRWRSFREAEDSRYVGLVLPRILLRTPYDRANSQFPGFDYEEKVSSRPDLYLWGNAVFALAGRLVDSFAKYRWCPNIIGVEGGGLVQPGPPVLFEALGRRSAKIPIQTRISEAMEFTLAEAGFIALTWHDGSDRPCFFSANSLQKIRKFGPGKAAKEEELNFRLGAQLPYLFIVTRFAHYIKVLQREQIGTWKERTDLESELNNWLRQYISDMDDPAPGVRGRRPLRRAQVMVSEVESQPGWYKVSLKLRPHLRYMGAMINLSLMGKLDKE
ncbi:MAG: type VI secretion system contractile sheath large subunit [Deltaproteobacteria bacterium]|nr:type VI secretion system contractile sheath large subunit [Deltaproteobacteria bacterium]